MIHDAEVMWQNEEDRAIAATVTFIRLFPEYRIEIAKRMLAVAVATADSMGINVQAFLNELRRTEPMPEVLVPPKETPP